MILEVRNRPAGLGYQRQRWPKATHHIVRLGNREVRVIVTLDETANPAGLIALIIAGIFLG